MSLACESDPTQIHVAKAASAQVADQQHVVFADQFVADPPGDDFAVLQHGTQPDGAGDALKGGIASRHEVIDVTYSVC